MRRNFIMVLGDGETYSSLPGCAIVAIPEGAQPEDIDDFLASGDTNSGGFEVVTLHESVTQA